MSARRLSGSTSLADVPTLLTFAAVALLPVQVRVLPLLRFAPTDVLAVLALVSSLGRIPRARRAWPASLLAVAGVLAIGMATVELGGLGVDRYAAVNKFFGFFVLVCLYAAVVSNTKTLTELRRHCRVFVWSTTVVAAVSMLSAAVVGLGADGIDWLLNEDPHRLSGTLVDPNAFAGLLVVALGLHLGSADTGLRKAFLLPLAVLVPAILLTYSRTGWAAAVALLIYAARRDWRLVGGLAVMGGATGFAVFSEGVSPAISEQSLRLALRTGGIDQRTDMFRLALETAAAHPILGIGLGAFRRTYGQIVHNTGLWMASEMGLLGAGAFAFLVIQFGVMAARARRVLHGRAAAVATWLLAVHVAMFVFSLGIEALYQRHWWLVLALIASSSRSSMDAHTTMGTPQVRGRRFSRAVSDSW